MNQSARFHIVFDGPALEHNEMDVRDLAPSLLALSDVIEETNYVLNQEKAKVVVNVRASFKTGCFGVDLNVAQGFMNDLLTLFKGEDVVAAAALLGVLGFNVKDTAIGLIQAIKWIAGRKISKIKIDDKKETAKIIIDEDELVVEEEIIELLKSYKLRKSLEKSIVTPLEKEGITSVSFTCQELDNIPNNRANFVTIGKDERDYFVSPPMDDELIEDKEYETNLQVISVVFQEKNKWRFTEGGENGAFYAEVQDIDFVNRVQSSEITFARGDILRVLLRKKQQLKNGSLHTEYEVLKVLSRRRAHQQIKLFSED